MWQYQRPHYSFFVNRYFLIQKDIVTAEFRDVKKRVFNFQMVQSYKQKTVASPRKVKIIKITIVVLDTLVMLHSMLHAQSEQNADCSKINWINCMVLFQWKPHFFVDICCWIFIQKMCKMLGPPSSVQCTFHGKCECSKVYVCVCE